MPIFHLDSSYNDTWVVLDHSLRVLDFGITWSRCAASMAQEPAAPSVSSPAPETLRRPLKKAPGHCTPCSGTRR